uniref:NYN domain-containing protein n=1 Tax=Brassica oleracea var. oleracea TaxID=109376 RepID=A0A0D3AHR6_BRAOL
MGEEGETIEFYSGDETLVFWNMDDYPIPVGIDNLASFRSNIEEALDQMGFRGPKQFSVNCEQLNCETKEALGEARFFYLPIWLYDSPYLNRPYEASLVLVSDQFKHDAYYIEMLRNLKLIHYYVILVTPTEDINKPESPEWPGSLIDIGGWCPFNDETSEPCSKKYKGG